MKKDVTDTSLDNSPNIVQKAVTSAREAVEDSRRFFAEISENVTGTVSSIGQLIRRHAIKAKDDALSFLSLRRAGVMILLSSFNDAAFKITPERVKELFTSAKDAFATAGAVPLIAPASTILSAQFAQQAVAPEIEQVLVAQFNGLQTNIANAQDQAFVGPMPSQALEQLRNAPDCSDTLSNAFAEAGFVYTGCEQEIVCMPGAIDDLREKFNVLQEQVVLAQQIDAPVSQIQSLFTNAGFVYDPSNALSNGQEVTVSVMNSVSTGTKEVPAAGKSAHNDEPDIPKNKFPTYEVA